jgi:hypothetical protein
MFETEVRRLPPVENVLDDIGRQECTIQDPTNIAFVESGLVREGTSPPSCAGDDPFVPITSPGDRL